MTPITIEAIETPGQMTARHPQSLTGERANPVSKNGDFVISV
jgi:hypothetical protein